MVRAAGTVRDCNPTVAASRLVELPGLPGFAPKGQNSVPVLSVGDTEGQILVEEVKGGTAAKCSGRFLICEYAGLMAGAAGSSSRTKQASR